ncbi:heavy-metal-associated domain-containing protein [Desulfovibrionales bacterium]
MKSATLQLETLTCPSCMQKIEAALKAVQGVPHGSISVSFTTSKAKLTFDDTVTSIAEIEHAITKIGYAVLNSKVK